ncbi:sortase family protein [Pseudomonas botevensis]|uniref:hypothetical protein n=1 Tax=Pseudomonas botevensis TaxID=2842352 RepID=UPI001C3C2AB7|nr:hypothetical protein [Pseudomonas botevensis]MBV4476695.1 hypothetical protein [Pseudomonas botevensis]
MNIPENPIATVLRDDLNPDSPRSKTPSPFVYYRASFQPPLPSGKTEIRAKEFWFQSFTDQAESLLGSSGEGFEIEKLSLVIPKGLKDGTYPITSKDRPFILIEVDQVSPAAKSGNLTITRHNDGTISGFYKVEIVIEDIKYTVDGKFHLEPTYDNQY